LRIFKAETKGMHDDDAKTDTGQVSASNPDALESGDTSSDSAAKASETSPERNDS
jgi:hypothetical protein